MYVQNSTVQSRGFTLPEVLVVVAVIGILASLALSSLTDYLQHQEFKVTTETVKDYFLKARSQSQNGYKENEYGVHVATGIATLYVGPAYVVANPENEVYTLAGGVSASTAFSDGGSQILFDRLTGIPSATGTVLLTQSATGLTATITINGTGLIE